MNALFSLRRISIMASVFCIALFIAAGASAEVDAKAAARVHFQKGVNAFDARRYREAAEEFNAAYELSPAFVVLYNIGQVNVALGDSVEAVAAFTEYLKLGASTIPEQRRREVETEIQDQLDRVATLKISSTKAGAEIRVDGNLVGQAPLDQPLRLNAGRHTVQALLDGFSPQVRELELVGKAVIELEFDFPDESFSVPIDPSPGPIAAPPVAAPAEETEPGVGGQATMNLVAPVQQPTRDSQSVNWLRMTGYGVALGGVVLGTVGGLKVFNGVNQARDAGHRLSEADTSAQYDAALPDYQAGKELTETGWALAGVGAGVLLGGALLVLAAPSPEASAEGVRVWVSADLGRLQLDGSW